MSVDVSYNRRWWSNFFVTHNRALTAADYDEVTLTAPLNPRLPDGGGYPVTFLVRNAPQAVGATDPYYTTDDRLRRRNALLARRRRVRSTRGCANGLFLQGGTSTGRGVNDTCDVLTARFGRPMAPTAGTVIAAGIVDGQPAATPPSRG